jgi:hypothetical protein
LLAYLSWYLSSSAISDLVIFLVFIMIRTTAYSPVLIFGASEYTPDLNCSTSEGGFSPGGIFSDNCFYKLGFDSKPNPLGRGNSLIFLESSSVLNVTTPSGTLLHMIMHKTFKSIFIAF